MIQGKLQITKMNNGLYYKSNMQTNIEVIESALLNWICVLSNKNISSFFQLIDCQFYLSLLSEVQQFKLIEPIQDLQKVNYNELNLTQRIDRVKVLGRSIIRFYQTKLLKDVSAMKINYVQLCMGNHSQSMRFFSMIIGILATDHHSQIYSKLTESLQNIQQNDRCIIVALLQNSKNIGEPIHLKSQQSPLQRKKIIYKLQKYEQRIQELQELNQLIKKQFQQQKNKNTAQLLKFKLLEEEKNSLLQKIQVLEINYQKIQSEVSTFILKNQTLQKKLDIQKRHYEEMLAMNNSKVHQLDQEISSLMRYKKEFDQLKNINKQLKSQLNQRKKQIKALQQINSLLKLNYENTNKKYENLLAQHQTLQLKHQQLILDMQVFTTSQKQKSSGYNNDFYDSNQGSSNKYRVRDNLSLIKQNLSQMSINSIIKTKQEEGVSKIYKQSLYYSNPANLFQQSGIVPFSCKKNKNIYNVSEFHQQSKQKKDSSHSQQSNQQKQFLLNKVQLIRKNYQEQIEVLIMINRQLFQQNQQKGKIIKKQLIQKQKQTRDKQLFKEKLKLIDIFEHQREKIYDSKENHKENINPNQEGTSKENINSNQKRTSNQNEKVQQKNQNLTSFFKSSSNKSQTGYYQMVFN